MKILRAYFRNLFAIAASVSLVWRNFFHWNLSKMAIYGLALVTSGIFAAIPVGIVVYLFRTFVSSLDTAKLGEFVASGTVPTELLSQIIASWGTLLVIILMILLIVAIAVFFFAYAYFLLAKVHDSYLAGEKLPIRKNLYFSWSHIARYFSITAWVSWYLLVPVLVWILAIVILAVTQLFLGIRVSETGSTASIVMGGIYIFVTVLAAIWFLRIAIRCGFAVFLLLDALPEEWGKVLVYKSFELTKGKVWKLIFLALPFLLILGFFQGIIHSFEESLAKNRSFEYLTSLQAQSGTGFTNDYEFLSNFSRDTLSDEDNINILRLQARFEEKKDGIRAEYFDSVYPYLDTSKTDPYHTSSSFLFFILSFFLLEWVQAMIYLAIFRNTISTLSTWEMSNARIR